MPRTRSFLAPFLFACACLPFLWTGCSTPNKDLTNDLESHKAAAVAQPTMLGEGSFFDGKLTVEVKLGRGFHPRVKRGILEAKQSMVEEDDSGEKRMRAPTADDEDFFIPRMHNSILPPQALRIRVTNQMTADIEVEYLECNSSLGNFAVRPESAKIPAGQSHEPNPMTSLLGASGEDLPVKITLRVGKAVETQIVVMKLVAKPQPPKKE